MSRRSSATVSLGIRPRGNDLVGLILDSSIVIAAERRGHSVRQILEQIQASHGNIDIGLSVVTIAELIHGAYRAKTDSDKQRRLTFVGRLCSDVPVHPVTVEMARAVGRRIEGEQGGKGIAIPFEDLVIGVTALQLGFDVATLNVRHFQLIPSLKVVSH
jgi:predicted nucleic acid-binding protein